MKKFINSRSNINREEFDAIYQISPDIFIPSKTLHKLVLRGSKGGRIGKARQQKFSIL